MKCCCMDGKSAGLAVGRWALGVLFFFAGLGKIMGGVGGFVNGYLVPAYSETFLPGPLVTAYGYALPWVELLLGLGLILGICRNCVLFTTALTLISLAFGKMLVQDHATVANIFIYIVLAVILLVKGDDDTWRLRRKTEPDGKSSGCCCT